MFDGNIRVRKQSVPSSSKVMVEAAAEEQSAEVAETVKNEPVKGRFPFCCLQSGSPSLADSLWTPLRPLALNPKLTFQWYLFVNSIFIPIGEFNALLVRLLSWPGFFLLYLFLLYLITCRVARGLVYPIYNSVVLRSQERDIGNEVKKKYVQGVRHYNEFIEFLKVIGSSDSNSIPDRFLGQELQTRIASIDEVHGQIFQPYTEALELNRTLYSNGTLENEGEKVLQDLRALANAHECFILHLNDLLASTRSSTSEFIIEQSLKSMYQDLSLPKEAENKPKTRSFFDAVKRVEDNIKHLTEKPLMAPSEDKVDTVHEHIDLEDQLDETPSESCESHAPSAKAGGKEILFKLLNNLKWVYLECSSARYPIKAVNGIDLIRSDVQARMNARQVWITATDGTMIDALFVPAQKHESIPKFPDNRTILMCAPNAGIYEFALYQCHWAGFYTERGINVMMFNYRGYSRSGGKPTPERLRADGEKIAEYLVETEGVQKGWIGVHGESIGGVVATHLARYSSRTGVSLLVTDRTFRSLPAAADNLVASWAGKALQWVLGWESNNVDGFIAAQKQMYCVCTCDPNDEIIAHPASLKIGVARKLVSHILDSAGPKDDTNIFNDELAESTLKQLGVKDLEWLRDPDLVSSFVSSIHELIDLIKKTEIFTNVQSPQFKGNMDQLLTFINPLTNAINVLLFLDGGGGQHLGHAVAEEKAKHEKKGKGNMKSGTLKDSPVRDWIICLLIWGARSPSTNNDKSGLIGTDRWRLCGYSGAFGPESLIPIKIAVPALREFARRYAENLQEFECSEAFNRILSVLERVEDSVTFQNEKLSEAYRIGEVKKGMFLLPLTCGHNGVMSSSEQEAMILHLKRAEWL